MNATQGWLQAGLTDRSDTRHARDILRKIFRSYSGKLAVRLWRGEAFTFGGTPPDVKIVIHDPRVIRDLILRRDPLRLAEAYFRGLVDVEGSIYQVLDLKHYLSSLKLSWAETTALVFTALRIGNVGNGAYQHFKRLQRRQAPAMRHSRGHSRDTNRRNIAFHYDVSDEFYRLWLDPQMVYSCAYFEHSEQSLDQVQRNKLEHICRKLRLKPGERLLDIGCGWSALLCWAAKHHGVRSHGVTLSRNQYEYAQRQVKELGIEDQVTVEFRDYRDIGGDASFDKIASVGMFEHVGVKNFPEYFGTVARLLMGTTTYPATVKQPGSAVAAPSRGSRNVSSAEVSPSALKYEPRTAPMPWSAKVLKWRQPMRTGRARFFNRVKPWLAALMNRAAATGQDRQCFTWVHPSIAVERGIADGIVAALI